MVKAGVQAAAAFIIQLRGNTSAEGRDFERRLLRAEIDTAAISSGDEEKAKHRRHLRLVVKLHGFIRERLQAMEVDPELPQTLHDLEG